MKSIFTLLFIWNSFCSLIYANERLAQDSYWLKLLHIEEKQSDVDLNKELNKTILGFKQNPKTICQYPARYKWIDSKLHLNIKKPQCPKLHKFLNLNIKKISIIFTSERYDSPASIFGHTMMKLESDTIPYAINYSAKVEKNINSFSYTLKGITGKFVSGYSFMPFSIKEYEYRSGEFRDLIEFELNLSADEIENILLYFYEIKDTKEHYYFLSHNCSSEILKLVDMAKYDSALSHDFRTVTIPINIIYILNKYNYIKKISTKFSKLKQFYLLIDRLNENEKDILFKITHFKYSIKNLEINRDLSAEKKYIIIVSAINFFEIQSVRENMSQRSLYPLMKLIALKIKLLKKEKIFQKEIVSLNPISNKFHKISLGTEIDDTRRSSELIVGYRYLYRSRYDLLDLMKKNGTVELLDIMMSVKENKIFLERFTLLNLEAMPVSNIFFQESINKIKVEISRVFEENKLYTYFNYGLGYRYKLNRDIDYQFYTKTGIYYNNKMVYLASSEISLEYNYSNKYISNLLFEYNYFTNEIVQKKISLKNYIKLSNNKTFTLKLTHEITQQTSNKIELLLNYFF